MPQFIEKTFIEYGQANIYPASEMSYPKLIYKFIYKCTIRGINPTFIYHKRNKTCYMTISQQHKNTMFSINAY